MSFSGFGGGFGQNTNQSSGGFGGGFGANNNTTPSGFGSNTGGFGASPNTGGGMFGNNTASSGFGSTPGGFGSNTGGFGSKPAFGSTPTTTPASGGLFGASSTPSSTGTGFGGFGSNTNTTTPSAFGSNTTGGGLFGNANKPAGGFGTANSGSLFGGGNTNTTSNTGTGFGNFGSTNTLGGASGDPPGTGVTPFQAFNEKEPNSSVNLSNAFQNILFQDPYKKWSADELRLADYVQGRRHGNPSGAGAFGVNSGFGGGFGNQTSTPSTGGFGATNTGGGMFGSGNTANNTTSGFGGGFGAQNTPAASNTAGGLFGNANKPSGGLFGNTQQSQTGGMFGSGTTNPATAGGFGSNNTQSGGLFGATNNAAANTGGGLFGNTAQKPAGTGFSFGNNTNTPSTGFGATNSGFGSNTNTATGGGLFGNTNANAQPTGGLFGNNAQQQQNPSGGLFGQAQTQQAGGLFGNTQQKPATGGLFGSTPAATSTGGGLFGGNTAQQQGTTGLGGTNTNTGGLFGAKPATGTGLFGSAPAAANTGGGLFGGANTTQQAAGTGMFGSAANQQKPGLFGSTPAATGTGMFGGGAVGTQGGIFGNAGNQQQQSIGLGGSLLGASQAVNNAPQGLTANLSDVSAYGSPSLFSGVSGGEVPNPGPLAVPLSGQPKPKRPSIFPMYKFTPAASGRFGTPQKRGFGFSYSSYGTPGGASPAGLSGTPSTLGRNLLGASSSGTALSKSISSSNLRRTVNADDSILLPGAFSNTNNTRWYGSTGSKKLVINRELRSDLFSTPNKDGRSGDNGTGPRKLAKRVSFDTNVDGEDSTPVRALPAPGNVPETPGEDTPRSDKSTPTTNGLWTPEMEQVKGKGKDKELAIVQEEDSATPEPQANGFDNAPGQYWMDPSREELQNMNRIQRQRIDNFTVGRENVGSITFKIPVDISGIDLDELCGGIIQLEPRSATVYPIAAKKPPVGKGLNVPARITLEQSWPRGGRDKRVASDPKRFNKHIERLKRIVDTTFESYDVDTGVWVFSVEHFTTYGLDDSDEETDFDTTLDLSTAAPLSNVAPPAAFRPSQDDEMTDSPQSHMLPGAFDDQERLFATEFPGRQSFLGASSADSATHDVKLSLENEMTGDDIAEYDMSEDEDMTRSSAGQHLAAEHDDASSEGAQDVKRSTATPGGILRARMRAMKDSAGPVKLEVADGDDWMEMLRKTVSPMKRDRHLLREVAGSTSKQGGKTVTFDLDNETDFRKSSIWGKSMTRPDRKNGPATGAQIGMDQGRGFATSIDLMNSLFEKPKPKPTRQEFQASQSAKGFPKFPYERQTKVLTAEEDERAFHSASRPTWGPDETLVLIRSLDGSHSRRSIRDTTDILTFQRSSIQTDEQDIRLATFTAEPSKKYLASQDVVTEIDVVEGVPQANLHASSLKSLYQPKYTNDAASIHEKQVWELASILFDNLDNQNSMEEEHLARRNKLSQFWSDLVEQASSTGIGLAASSEEKALACLAGHRIPEACKHLLDGKNFRLATLVPLIGTSDVAKREMREQVKSWLDSKILSEFSEAIRTIYELLGGNVCVCEGLKGVPNEDRVDSFVISKHFGLDWRQSFGLRLWYAISNHDDLSVAVEKFKDDIDQDKEDLPRPWYVEQGIAPLWDDAKIDTRQDLLWGLLQLYADQDADLEAVLRPENSQLSPLDARLRWQLGIALTSTGKVSYGANGVEKADAATLAYAAQLTRAGEWLEAAFVLLHLHHTAARKKALQEHLCQHANLIGSESDANFVMLTEKYRIPAAWIWEALALYMRCVKKDSVAEMQCLLRAGSHIEAHRILVQHVAPQAIIERDYAGLLSLISQFQDRQQGITEWTQGGEIYGHFLQLIECRGKGESVSPALLDRLLAGLHAMKDIGVENNITRYAAISDMADETAREIVKLTRQKQDMELRSRILSLPLTQDRLLAYSVDLSLDRYREVMSH